MRKNYLMKSISIILMLLAMMFSCQPVTEDISSGNSNSNNTNQGGNTGGGGGEQTADTITITLIGTDGKEFDKFDIKIGEEIQLPANVERFVCWNTKADGNGESYTGKIKFTKDMKLYLIVLAKNAYTITYELNGGVNDKTNPLSFTADDKITLKEPSKDGYRFSGWYEKADFSGTAVKGWAAGDKKANVTLYAKWRAFDDKVLAVGGTGVYSYVTYIDALSGIKNYPSFSIFLMTDAQVTALTSGGDRYVSESEFAEATKTKPIYQICNYGEMGTDTTKSGDYAVWGRTPLNGKLECYEGIAASIKGTALTVTVDMTKLANAELKAYKNGEETFMTDDDTVLLNNYKPYISMNLDSDYDYENYYSYIVCLDFDDMYKRLYGMNSGASFPTNLKEDVPAVPTYRDLTYFYSNINQYPVELKNNVYTFVAPENGDVMFFFMNYNPYDSYENYPIFPLQIGGEKIDSLNKNFQLADLFNNNGNNGTVYFQIDSGVLTAGKMYTITLDVRGDYDAYAKVSEMKAKSISINSKNHKTSYYVGDDINVANLTVEATTSDGTKVTVNVTADMISGFDSSKLGKQTLTITMDGCTTTYSVEVSTADVRELSVTASEVVETIKGLTAGEYYKIKVSGTLDSDTMSNIQDALEVSYNAADYPKIALDLGNTTGLTYINNSFYNCHGLTSIVFPEGMTSIPDFRYCDSLTSITIPASVENVNSISNCKKFTTFEVAENNEYYSTSADGKILYNKDKTVLESYPSASGDVTIPNSVTSIGYEAFRGCNSLTSVIIPDSVTSIGSDAFENCENLESVTIGAGVTSISSDSFSGCSSLTSIEVDSANQEYSSDGEMLLSKDKTTLLMYPSATGDVTIPNGVTTIGSYAFYDCRSLTSVTILDSVTTIEYNAFSGCQNLESVTLGKNVRTIGGSAFEYCYKLASIEIPDGVTSIGSYAFYYCESLTSVTIPDSVTKIGYNAFSGCEALTSVTFENTNGWYSYDYNTGEFSIDVTDEEQNVTYLTDIYEGEWYRVLTEDVINTNVYSYKLDIEDISTVYGGSPASPTFSVVLATDEQVSNGYGSYDYRLSAYGNMKIADTSQTGSYVVYGQDVQNGEYQYYTGIAATVTDTTFELIVDMSKIKKTEFYNVQDEYIDFTEYKPYVIALGTYENDPYNSVNGSGMMKMTSGAKFPTNPTKGAPKVPDCYDLKYIAGCATNWTHELMDGNSFNFTYTYYPSEDDGYNTGYDRFAFTNGGWDFKAGGVQISSLGVPFKLRVGGSDITFDSYLLTEGNEYTISLSVDGEDEAYVMVTEEKAEAISVNSTNHKTTYDVGDYLDVSGLTIEVTKEDGTTKTVYVTESMVDGFYSYIAGTRTLTITYGGCITTFDVTVVANVSLTEIEIVSEPDKTSYYVGEELDLEGLVVRACYSDYTTSVIAVTSDMVSGFNSSKVGTQTVTITYCGYTATFTVDVEKQLVYHTITFNANDGSGTMAPRTVGETSSYYFNIASDFTAPTGYGFSHWNTKADGSGTTYERGDYYPILEDITLYAQWKKVESNLNVELPESTRFSISQTVNGDKVKFKCSYSYYNSYAWFIDGVKQTSTSSEMTVDTSTMDAGSYTVMLTVKYDGKYWSENATLTIKK